MPGETFDFPDETTDIKGPINSLDDFIIRLDKLLELVSFSRYVLFRVGFRENFTNSLEEIQDGLRRLIQLYPDFNDEIIKAGLSGNQLKLKLESFEASWITFYNYGGIDNLEDVLDKGNTILKSLAGAIPGFGSFAQEFVEFILKELKNHFRFWKKKKGAIS